MPSAPASVADANSDGSTGASRCDVLFLYRTGKKKRYFAELMASALGGLRCRSFAYHALPAAGAGRIEISAAELQACLQKAEQEMFNARQEAWALALKPIVMAIRRRQIVALYRRLAALLQSARPRLVLIWNGHKFQDHVLHAVNRHFGIPLGFFENGVLPRSTTLDFTGINARNSVPRDPAFYAGRASGAPVDWSIQGREYLRRSVGGEALPEHYLLVPFQKERDSQILENSNWIRSMPQLVDVVTQALEKSGNADLHAVFRPHPSAVTQYPALVQAIRAHPRLHVDGQTPLAEAIRGAQAVITVNSSVGMEALLLGRKAIVLGEAYYAIPGLAQSAASVEALAGCIGALPAFSVQEPLRSQFVHYLQHDYVVPGDWRAPDAAHFARVRAKVDARLAELAVSRPDAVG